MSALGFSLGVALTLLCAFMLARALTRGGDLLWRVFCVVALFPIVVTLVSLAAGLSGVLHAQGLYLLLAASALVGGGDAFWRRRTRQMPDATVPLPTATGHAGSLDLALSAAAALACLVPAWLVVRELVLGECRFAFDDYAYHGVMLAHWLQQDALHLAPAKYQAYYPGGGELFSAFFIELGGGDAFAQLASVYWALLATLCFPVAGAALGTRRASMLVAGGLLLCSPIVTENLGTIASVDMAAGSATLATIAAGLRLTGAPDGSRPHREMLFLGLLAGLAVGAKVTVVVLVAPMLLAFLLIRVRGRWRGAEAATLALSGLLGGVLTGGYWYIRNLVATGNPLFPAQVLWFDGPLDRAFQRSTSLLQRVVDADGKASHLARIQRELLDWPHELVWASGLGMAFALLVAPWLRKDAGRWLLPALALLACLSFWVIFAGPFSGSVNAFRAATRVAPRMFLPVMMIALLLAGAGLGTRHPGALRWLGWLATLAGTALVAKLVHADEHLPQALFVSLTVVGLWLAGRALATRAPSIPAAAGPIAASLLILASVGLLATAVRERQAHFDGKIRGWLDGALAELPPGSRIATPNVFSYYALFGPDFQLDPYRVDSEGKPYPMLHVRWANDPYYSWNYEFGAKWKPHLRAAHEARLPKTGWRAIEDPEQRKKAAERAMLASIRDSGAQYVAVATYHKASILHGAKPKRRKRRFPPIARLLDRSPEFERLRTEKHIVLWTRRQ